MNIEQTSKNIFMYIKVDSIKNLSTTIEKKGYTLSDVNDLVNKIDSEIISRDEAINSCNDIAKKVKKLQK